MVPAEIEPFVGTEYSSSADIYLFFHGLAEMPVETFGATLKRCVNSIGGDYRSG